MYQKYNQHPELIRLIGAAAVSKQFRQMSLQNPRQILEHGYLGYQFDLTAEEATAVNKTVAGTIQEFSLQLWEWMGHNGHESGNGSQPARELPQMAQPFEKVLASVPVSTVSGPVEEEKEASRRFSASQPTSLSRKGRISMDPLVLIVEDNQEMAEGLQFALEIEGFRVALASDGEVAIEFLGQEQPDLILADVKMPRMDGYALLRAVKQNAEWSKIPFVFVTAAADWRKAVTARAMGADEYIVKPFELEDLISVVRQLTNVVEKVKVGSVVALGRQANQAQSLYQGV